MKKWLLLVVFLLLIINDTPAKAENIIFPANSGVIDMSKPPYNLTGDGVTDVTATIQGVLSGFAASGSGGQKILYFPNGTYVISGTLSWSQGAGSGGWFGFLNFQGQSQAGTIFKLKDNAAGFGDVMAPKPMMNCGYPGSADLFWNSVRNLTFSSGSGNPGAIGIQFFSNNQGILRDVTIKSGDGFGIAGLDLGYQNLNGPLLIKNLTVDGFNTGISDGYEINSQTFENITLRNQKVIGFNGNSQEVFIRGLHSTNSVPVFNNTYAVATLIDGDFTGIGAANTQPAITNGGAFFARNITTSGYAKAIKSNSTTPDANGPNVAEYVNDRIVSLFPSPPHSLNLPVNETPDVPYDDPATWANVRDFGARGDGPNIQQQYRGADGFGYDGGVWGNAIVTKADGTVKHLAGQYDYRYAGGSQHTLTADEIGWTTNSFNYQFPVIDSDLKVNGVTYPRGISICWSDFTFPLNGAYKTFTSDVGVNDSTQGAGSVQFEVYCDGVLKFNSYIMYGFDPTLHINLDVTGVQNLRIKMGDGEDDTRYVQAAIDSGATTVYFPNSKHNNYRISDTVFIRGNVRRLTSTQATVTANPPGTSPGFKFMDGAAPIVQWDRLGAGFGGSGYFFEHAAARTFVMKNAQFGSYTSSGTGDLYIEDVVGGPFTFNHQNVWARQFNVENHGTHVTNNGGNLWILGMKTESGGTLIDTENGGKTELLGLFCYTTESGALAPMFINNNSSLVVTGQSEAWYSYNDSPYLTLVQETRGTETRNLKRGDVGRCAMGGSAIPLYTGYIDLSETAPPRPPYLIANAGDSRVVLNWGVVATAYRYNVKRSSAATGPFTVIGRDISGANFTDSTAQNGTTYYYAVTAENSNAESGNSNVAQATPQAGQSGNGLLAQYFNDTGNGNKFTALALTRIDPTVNFDYGNNAPAAGVQADNFSIRWTGKVLPAASETVTFYVTCDDGARLTVNGQKIIDAFYDQAPTEYSGTINLTAGQKADIKLEYYEHTGGAACKLAWSSGSVAKQIVPTTALFAPITLTAKVALDGIGDMAAIAPNLDAVQFVFRAPGSLAPQFVRAVTPVPVGSGSAQGVCVLTDLPSGTFDVAVKSPKNLRVVYGGVSLLTAGGLPDAFLPGGDANNDNSVDVLDFGALVNAYGTDAAQNNGYDRAADFNDDGRVDVLDFGVLVNNYGVSGAL